MRIVYLSIFGLLFAAAPASASSGDLMGSGSILLSETLCNHFYTDTVDITLGAESGTMDIVFCDEWATTVDIGALKFLVDALALVAKQSIELVIIYALTVLSLFYVSRWFFRRISQQRT